MMHKKIAIGSVALALGLVGFGVGLAWADDPFEIATGKGEITVTTKGHWHVNKDYPWKVVVGDKTLDKSKFSLSETSAKVSGVPQGTVKLKGAVCEGTQCVPFAKDVTVQ